jgi:hypothetical protein
MKERPDLTARFAAVDGIAKPERNFRDSEDCVGNPCTRADPAENAIRPDVADILGQDDRDFELWYRERQQAILSTLGTYKLISSVPDLYHGSSPATFGGRYCVSSTVETLEKAYEHLLLLYRRRAELKESWLT